MTWFWFVLIGIIALVARASIAGSMAKWSVESLKQVAMIGLTGFGIMATFGIAFNSGAYMVHIVAALGGIMGFFAISELNGRKARIASEQALAQGQRRAREFRESRGKQPAGAPTRWQDSGDTKPEPLVRIQEPPLITDQDSPAHILELLERAAGQWENPETETPAPPEPQREAFQSVAQILARATEQKEESESVGAFHNVPAATHILPAMHGEPPDASQPAPDSRFSSQREDVDDAPDEGARPYRPAGVKLAGTPLMMAAQTLSPDSAVARASGPVTLGRSLPLRPPGPLSLGGTSPGPVPMEQHAKSGGFHYQPLMVRSRLGTSAPFPKLAAARQPQQAESTEPVEPEADSAERAPAAGLQ